MSEIIKLKKEVTQLREKLCESEYGNNDIYVRDKVKGSMAQFPYSAKSFNIGGYEEMSERCIKKRSEIGVKISNKYDELYKKINDALDYIQKIEDSEIRQILTYKYIDGLTWEQTGQSMNYSWETVRKKHDKFMKIIPPNTTLNGLQ